jgi:uncharacterized membrane protein
MRSSTNAYIWMSLFFIDFSKIMLVVFIVGGAFIFVGALMAFLAIPLMKRKVKPNGLYGVRTPEAFASEESWYAINEFGGRKLLQSSYVWFVGGILAMLAPYILPRPIAIVIFYCSTLVVPLAALLLAIIPIVRYSQDFRKKK